MARCPMCGGPVKDPEPTFKMPCKVPNSSGVEEPGFCTSKGSYERCEGEMRCTDHWMCWRDGIWFDAKGEGAGGQRIKV